MGRGGFPGAVAGGYAPMEDQAGREEVDAMTQGAGELARPAEAGVGTIASRVADRPTPGP